MNENKYEESTGLDDILIYIINIVTLILPPYLIWILGENIINRDNFDTGVIILISIPIVFLFNILLFGIINYIKYTKSKITNALIRCISIFAISIIFSFIMIKYMKLGFYIFIGSWLYIIMKFIISKINK